MAEETPAEKPAATPEEKPEEKPVPAPAEKPAAEPAPAAEEKPAPEQPAGEKGSSLPFILALIGGIVILLQGALGLFMESTVATFLGMVPGMETLTAVLGATATYVGLVLGVIVILGAVLLRSPGKAKIGGILVLVLSIVALVTGGGFLIGSILGIIGGALGLKG